MGADVREVVIPAALTFAAIYIPGGHALLPQALTSAGIAAVSSYASGRARRKSYRSAQAAIAESQRRLLNVREPISPRNTVYGTSRVGGPLFYMTTHDQHLSYGEVATWLTLVIGFAGHEIEDYAGFWINDDFVELAPASPPSIQRTPTDPKYSRKVWITPYLGTSTQRADGAVMSASRGEWDSTRRLQGIAYCVVQLRRDPNLFQGIPRINAVIRGKKVRDLRSTSTTPVWTNNPANILADYYQDENVLDVRDHELDIPAFQQGANIADVMHPVNNDPTSANYGTYTATGTVIESDVFFNDLDRVYVGHPTNTSASTNITGFALSDGNRKIQVASSIDNARAGTFLTPPPATGNVIRRTGEPAYTFNGSILSTERPYDVISDMLIAQNADNDRTSGMIGMIPDMVNPTPVGLITESDVIGDVIASPKIGQRGTFSAIKGVFTDAAQGSLPIEYPEYVDTLAVAEDGRKTYADLNLENTNSKTMAQRLARARLAENRRQEVISLQIHLDGLKYRVGDAVNVRLPRLHGVGVTKLFTIVEMTVDTLVSKKSIAYAVSLGLKEAVDTRIWRATDDDGELSYQVVRNLPSAFDIEPPANITLDSGTDQLTQTRSGVVLSNLKVSWVALSTSLVNDWIIQWKKSTESWDVASTAEVPQVSRNYTILNLQDGDSYDVRVAARSASQVQSTYVQELNHMIVGKQEPPPSVIGFQARSRESGTREFQWDTSNQPPDVRAGGRVVLRYSENTNVVWSQMKPLAKVFPDRVWTTENLQAGNYSFAAKMEDSSENESVNATIITATLGRQNLGEIFRSESERENGFNGTITEGIRIRRSTATDFQIISSPDANTRWDRSSSQWQTLQDSWDDIAQSDGNVVYTSQIYDLGTSTGFFATPTADWQGASITLEMMYSDTLTSGGALASPQTLPITAGTTTDFLTARYITLKATVVHRNVAGRTDNAVLRDLGLSLSATQATFTYSNINTASSVQIPGYSKLGVGRIRVQHLGGAGQITTALPILSGTESTSVANRARVVAKVAGNPPYADINLYRGDTLTDGTLDVILTGPRRGQ